SSYGSLGGLNSQANFHARPGVELDYNGNITLASNWNFAAGIVDVAGATTAGLMTTSPATGEPSIVVGDEAAILAGYTHLLYRVGAGNNALGEPGDLSIRAMGNLNIGQPNKTGSITDGFFTFGDQTDPNYLANSLSSGNTTVAFATSCTGSCSGITDFLWGSTALPSNRLAVNFGGSIMATGAKAANPI